MTGSSEEDLRSSIRTRDLDSGLSSSSSRSNRFTPRPIYDDETHGPVEKTNTLTSVTSNASHLLLRTPARNKTEQNINRRVLLNQAEKIESIVNYKEKLYNFVYPGYFLDHVKNVDSWKVVIRTWISAWLCFVVTLIPESHHWLGNASFLLMILVYIQPPGGKSVADVFFSSLYTFTAVVYAWLHCLIAVAISVRVRRTSFDSATDLAQHLILDGVCENNPDTIQRCIQRQIFKGRFLDLRATVISAIATGICVMTFLLLKIKWPLYNASFVLGNIVAIIGCTYGNFFPYLGGARTMAQVFFRPFAVGLGFNIALSCLLFPTTSLYKIIGFSIKKMLLYQKYSEMQMQMIREVKPSSDAFYDFSALHGVMTKARGLSFPIMLDARFINMEFTYLRLKSTDVEKWGENVVEVGNTLAGLEYFYMNMLECKRWLAKSEMMDVDELRQAELGEIESHSGRKKYSPVGDFELKKRLQSYKNYFESGDNITHAIQSLEDLDHLVTVIARFFQEPMQSCHEVLTLCKEWINLTNEYRLERFIPTKNKKYLENIRDCNERLRIARKKMNGLAEPSAEDWRNICVIEGKAHLTIPVIGQASLFSFIIKRYSYSLDELCELIEDWNEKKLKPTLQFPFEAAWKKLRKHLKPKKHKTATEESDPKSQLVIDLSEKDHEFTKRSPDALPPNTRIGNVMRKVAKAYVHVVNKTPFLFAVRSAVIVVLCNFMAYTLNTCYWYYGHRGVWGPILISISISANSYDSIYMAVSRVASTLCGAIIGACAWYIGAGSGKGNYYGLGAVCLVVFYLYTYHRHFSVHLTPLPGILSAVTFVLVIGSSWQDSQFPPVTNLHWGLSPAYCRFIAVVFGVVVAFLVSCFPIYISGASKIRATLSSTLKDIGDIHCQVKNSFIEGQHQSGRSYRPLKNNPARAKIFSCLLKVSSTYQIMKRMKYEPQVMGKWPKGKYQLIVESEIHILKLYYLLLASLETVDDHKFWKEHIRRRLGWEDENLSSDFFSVIFMCSSALGQASALPRITPSELALKHLNLLTDLGLGDPLYGSDDIYYKDPMSQRADRSASLLKMDTSVLMTNDGRNNMVTLILMHLIYEKIDQILILVKSLVGEEYNFSMNIDSESDHEHVD